MAIQVKSYVSNFAQGMKNGNAMNVVCGEILKADQANIKDPAKYAAGLAYVANLFLNSGKTQKEIADSMGCTVGSLRKEYRGIAKRNAKLIEDMEYKVAEALLNKKSV